MATSNSARQARTATRRNADVEATPARRERPSILGGTDDAIVIKRQGNSSDMQAVASRGSRAAR